MEEVESQYEELQTDVAIEEEVEDLELTRPPTQAARQTSGRNDDSSRFPFHSIRRRLMSLNK